MSDRTNYISEYMGLAAAATTGPASTPRYGLVYNLATNQWVNAAQFQEFVRSVLPATQEQRVAQAAELERQSAHNIELQKATNYQNHGLLMADSEFTNTNDDDESWITQRGNDLKTGFSQAGNKVGQLKDAFVSEPLRAVPIIGGFLGGASDEDESNDDGKLYERYTAKGGLLTEEEFNSFNENTRSTLYRHAKSDARLQDVSEIPGVEQTLGALNLAYRAAVTGVEMTPNPGSPLEFLSQDAWAKAWRESQGTSLGNALINQALDPFVSDETLDRWKRDNPWYQMSSAGTEFLVAWYADPAVIAGKATGAAARLSKGELPINEGSTAAIQMRRSLADEAITTRNPLTKAYVLGATKRIQVGQRNVENYARVVSAPEFAELPMFKTKARAVDGGASAYALHWAINNESTANAILNSSKIRNELQDVADSMDFELAPTLDVKDLTWKLTLGDPKAWAMLNKLQKVSPEELSRIAPGSQTLLDSMSALKTKADVLQNEVADLAREADAIEAGGGRTTPRPMFHRWEVHTSLADKQRQLGEATDALHKYGDYQNWLDLLTAKANPTLARVQGPSRSRWSDVRNRQTRGESETRSLFMDNQYGHAHSFTRIPKGVFLKRANTAEIHNLDSGLMSINRQWDQYEYHFGYVPEGARETYLNNYVRAQTPMERYKVLHDLEETHLTQAIAHRFGIEAEMAKTIVNKIYDERNKSIRGILSGDGQMYRTAPSLSARLGGEDATVDLVSRNEETKTVTISVMNGRHKQTFEIPEEALAERVSPEDVTQTPNYYNPLDTRRLFYQLKHDESLLQELNAGFVRRDSAAIANAVEVIGTKFNEFWKPAQLFRLGWPMRVLMDEGARATAIVGPMYWLTGPGREAIQTSAMDIGPAFADWRKRRKHGKLGASLEGPGPVTAALKRSPNQFVRDAEIQAAPVLPEQFFDKINPARYDAIHSHVDVHADWKRRTAQAAYWRSAPAIENPTPAQQRLLAYGEKAARFDEAEPLHPIHKVIQSLEGGATEPRVFDAANGRSIDRGFAVPVTRPVPVSREGAVSWYADHAEILSRRGMRVYLSPEGELSVARTFKAHEFTKAQQYSQYVAEAIPGHQFWDIKKHRFLGFEDASADSPMSVAMYGHFADAPEGDATPTHRDGLHTAIPVQLADAHGILDAYAVRADGRRIKVFDVDRNPDGVAQYLRSNGGAGVLTRRDGDAQRYVWVTPERLTVRAAYAPTKGFVSLPEWFSHPRSIEVPVRRSNREEAESGELRAREAEFQDLADLSDFDFEMDSPTSWLFNKIRDRRAMGAGYKKIRSSDGETFYVPNAFEGHRGQLFRALTSSNGALDVLSEGHGAGLSLFRRRSEGYRAYAPPTFSEKAITDLNSREHKKAVRYFQVYADTINDHFGNSPIIQRMIKGQSNDEITDWLDNTPEGARIRNEVKPKEMPTGIWVDDHRFKLDYYVPSGKLQRLLGKGRLKPSDFRRNIPDENLPTIYGPDLEVLDRRRNFGEFVSDQVDRMWAGLGSVPIDRLSRHPFAKAMYDAKMKNLISSTDSKWLSPEMLDHYEKQATQHAMNEVRRTLYNLTDGTNFNDALRFVAPFWGAQYEAITKWLRIISDRPETVARFFAGQRAVYNNFVVVDEEGNEVKTGIRGGGLNELGIYHPDDRVIVQLPDFVKKNFPGLDVIGSVGIPIGSANTVLQGEMPLFPGMGPLVTIPVDQFMRKVSDTYGVEDDQSLMYRWLFPVGRSRSDNTFGQLMDQLSPGWGKRVMQASGSEADASRINMEMLVGREMLYKARQEGKPDPTAEDIKKAADHLWATRIISGLVQPFQVQYLPEHQYWIDAAHRYQKQYGQEWWDKFIDDYHEEAAIFATSSSNSVGVPPTNKGMEEWSANKALIQKFPQWTSAIISPQAYMGEFSSDAYGQQFNITLGPGDTRTLRSTSSLQDRLINDPETQLGWREYRKLNAALEAELAGRGLTSIQQRGAEDLQQLKRAAVAQLMQKYRAWAREYQVQSDEIYSDIEDLKQIAGNPMFDKRPDWQGVRQYLTVRQQVTDALDAYGQQGGSRSLQAQENGAIRDWFYNQVGALVQANPAFAEFYSRYLDSDTLTLGGGGF